MTWLGLKKKTLHGFVTERFCRSLCVVKKGARSDRVTTCPNQKEVLRDSGGSPKKEKKNRSSGGGGLLVIAGYSLFRHVLVFVTRIRPQGLSNLLLTFSSKGFFVFALSKLIKKQKKRKPFLFFFLVYPVKCGC